MSFVEFIRLSAFRRSFLQKSRLLHQAIKQAAFLLHKDDQKRIPDKDRYFFHHLLLHVREQRHTQTYTHHVWHNGNSTAIFQCHIPESCTVCGERGISRKALETNNCWRVAFTFRLARHRRCLCKYHRQRAKPPFHAQRSKTALRLAHVQDASRQSRQPAMFFAAAVM